MKINTHMQKLICKRYTLFHRCLKPPLGQGTHTHTSVTPIHDTKSITGTGKWQHTMLSTFRGDSTVDVKYVAVMSHIY